jgi:hypothetical protein
MQKSTRLSQVTLKTNSRLQPILFKIKILNTTKIKQMLKVQQNQDLKK